MIIKNKIIIFIYKIYKKWGELIDKKEDAIDKLVLNGIGNNRIDNKTALLSYSMNCLLNPASKTNRSIGNEMMEMLNILINLGYKVTVVDCKKQLFNDYEYDLIVGLGCSYRSARTSYGGKRVLYLTEGVPSVSEIHEKRRVRRFNEKYGINVGLQRSNVYYNEIDLQIADAIIFLGDKKRGEELRHFSKKRIIQEVSPTVILKGGYCETEKNNKRIVMISSGGVVHKGVDLVYESIANLKNVTLDHFGALGYLKYIIKRPRNLTQHGFVDLNNEKYQNIMREARFVILLSASEACPTSVINAMMYGCIPIVSPNCGMNEIVEKAGYFISEVEPHRIQDEIKRIINQPQDVLKMKSEISKKMVENLTIFNYRGKLEEAFRTILHGK